MKRQLSRKQVKRANEAYWKVYAPTEKKMELGNVSFCEAATAGPNSPWHIRRLTFEGRKLGGGCDTAGLCGRQVSWDLSVAITEHHLTHCCPTCREIYKDHV